MLGAVSNRHCPEREGYVGVVVNSKLMSRRAKTYRWEYRDHQPEKARSLSERYRLHSVVASVMANRGLALEHDELMGFIKPQLSTLHDPFLMAGMTAGVERMLHAIRNNECIVVFGDYDAD